MDKVFYWAGVWAIMVYGTVAANNVYRAIRRKFRERGFVRYIRLMNTDADAKMERPESDANADAESDAESEGG